MFKCAKCETGNNKKGKLKKGNTGQGVKEFKVITVIRKVRYQNQVRYDKTISTEETSKIISSFKNVKETTGTEIVEEESYCKEHIPKNINVKVLDGEVKRINIIKIKKAYKGEN